jgi:hypothetical protein
MDVDLVPHDQSQTRQPQRDADPLQPPQGLAQPTCRDHRSKQRLHRQDQRRDTRGHAQILGVVAAAQIHRMHQQPGHQHMPELGAGPGPARLRKQHDRQHADHAEAEAQAQESEGRGVLQPGLRGQEATAPNDDEVPGENGIGARQ